MPSRVICAECQFRLVLAASGLLRRPWQIQQRMASAMRQRKIPSRMILADDVSRGVDQKTKQRNSFGPFAGMNQREARLPARFANQTDRSRSRIEALAPRKRQDEPHERSGDVEEPDRHAQRKPNREKDGKKEERPLFHALKMQATLAPLSYNQRDALKQKLEKVTSFEQLGLIPSVVNAIFTQALPGLTDYSPTPVQKLAIPTLLSKDSKQGKGKRTDEEHKYDQFLIAAETGSGKTLAYLLPVIDAVKQQEQKDAIRESEEKAQKEIDKEQSKSSNIFDLDPSEDTEPAANQKVGRPRALILLPSSELVTQVGRVVKVISHTVKYKSAPISASNTPTVIRNRLFNPNGIDIVISTPHLISSIAEKEPSILSRIQHLVVDEADSLLDRSFSTTTCNIIDRAAPSLKQLILCSATIPRSLDKFIDKRFPDLKRIVTPKLHTITRRVQLGVVDIDRTPYNGQRSLACADVIWQLGKSVHDEDQSSHHIVKSVLVFVNERDQAEEVAKVLASKGIDAVALTRDTSEQRQAEVLSAFTSPGRVEGEEKEAGSSSSSNKKSFRDFVPFDSSESKEKIKQLRHLPNTKVLVTTDLGSRGIDTLAVRHVILHDVPHSTIDFVHRLGRVGRMGRRGRGIVLVGKKDRKDVVREVRDAMFRGQALI